MSKRLNLRLINLYYGLLKLNNVPKIIKSLKIFYPVKIHPEYFEKKNFSLTEILNKIFFKIINIFKNYFYGIFYSKEITLKQRKVLILSHLINKNNLKIKNDFYFGEIGKILKEKTFLTNLFS